MGGFLVNKRCHIYIRRPNFRQNVRHRRRNGRLNVRPNARPNVRHKRPNGPNGRPNVRYKRPNVRPKDQEPRDQGPRDQGPRAQGIRETACTGHRVLRSSSGRRISDNSFLENRASEMPPSICRGPKTLNPSKKWSIQLQKRNVRGVEVTERYKFFGATPVFVIKSSQGGWTACKLLPRLTLQQQYHIRYEIRYII